MSYNGWSNFETWQIALNYNNFYDRWDDEVVCRKTVRELSINMEDLVKEVIEMDCNLDDDIISTAIDTYLKLVNWEELAKSLKDDLSCEDY